MRNAIIGWGVLFALLGSGTARAQHEEALAKAYQLEEVEGRVAEALAGYESVAAATKLPERPCFDALMGKARCLRRLARFEEASAVVAELEAAHYPWVLGNTVKLERERLERARGEQDEERKKVRAEVLAALAAQGPGLSVIRALGARAIPTLEEVAGEGSPQPQLAITAWWLLTSSREPSAIEALLNLVRRDALAIPSAELEREYWGLNRPEQVVVDLDPVIAALVQSENPLLRKGGVVSFRSLRAPAPELVRRALGDADFRVRLQLLEWLRAAPPWVDRELYGDCLRALARDPQFEIRQKMTSYLSEIARRNQLLAGEIADVLTRDEAQEIRAGAFEYLGNVRALESQRELLERGLADVHPPIRLLCAQRFQKALRSADIPVLLAFLRDLNEERRRNAAELLWRFPPEELVSSAEALEQLWYALEDTQDTPRALASRALARVLKREELPRLLPQLQDQSSRIRGFVFEAVLRLDAIEALPAIVAALPLLASVVDPRGGESKLSHLDLLRWLIEKNHRMELEQVLAHVSKLTLSNSVVELLDAALDAEQKSALLEAAALGEDRKRAADALYALRRFGRGNPEFLRTCLELRAGTVDQESRARLTSILCEEGGLESFDAILEELSNPQFSNSGGSIPSAARYFARWTDEVRRPRLEEALRASPGQWAWFTQGKPVEQATFAYLQAVANAEPSSSGGVYAHLVALAKHTDPDGAALVLAQLRGPRVSPSTSVGELVARGTTSSEQASLFVSRHVLALRLGRPADFASYTREILGEERYADDARHSAVLLCALLPDGSGDAVILESLEHANGTVRAAAARAAAHLLLAGAIPRLKELLRDHEASFEANHALLRFAAFGYPIR